MKLRNRRTLSWLTTAVATTLSASAWAQDGQAPQLPIDIEMIRPSFSPYSGLGMDTGRFAPPRTLTLGLVAQHERNPLRLYEYDELSGNVVARRTAMQLGFTYTASRRIGLRLMVPMALHQGSQVPEFAGDGFGLGDISLGLRANPGRVGPVHFSLHGDLYLPTGTKTKYMGERLPRAVLGSAITLDVGPVEVTTDIAGHIRGPIVTSEDLSVGSELLWNNGVRVEIVPEILFANAELYLRSGFTKFFTGAGENALEGLFGLQTYATENIRIDVGAGRGFTEGYGTSTLRILGGLTWVWTIPKKEVEEPQEWVEEEIPEEPDIIQVVEEPKPEWKPEQLARIEEDQIVIRDPIQFELDTTHILPVSMPTLEAVARVLNENANIGHLVIEGHASAEGSFEYNYDLAMRRAEAIYKALVEEGVHPYRMSFRSMGEVVPTRGGEDEASLAPNRRVEFHIVKQFHSTDKLPEFETHIKLPWTGGDAEVLQPTRPPPKVVPVAPAPQQPIEPDHELTPVEPSIAPEPSKVPTPEGMAPSERIPKEGSMDATPTEAPSVPPVEGSPTTPEVQPAIPAEVPEAPPAQPAPVSPEPAAVPEIPPVAPEAAPATSPITPPVSPEPASSDVKEAP